MEIWLNSLLDRLLGALAFVYGERWVVPFLVVPVMLLAALAVYVRANYKTAPYLRAVKARITVIRAALGNDPDPVAERSAFSYHYAEVAAAMNQADGATDDLVQAWREFHESIIDETTTPIRNTNRPGAFFHRAAPKQTTLIFASNIFVGLGLILTFLGLIVALNTAANGMRGSSVSGAQSALTGLLVVAGAKFFSSVGGLGASIWLRFAEHRLAGSVSRATETLCGLLERGLLYIPLQRLAVEQLEVMKEQRDQLKFFNTDVALQLSERIGAQFQQAIAPVTASLSLLNDSMTSVTQGIGAGAKEAIEKVSGDQLRGLSDALGALGQRLDAISGAVGTSGDEAARQIRVAGADFAQAASDIRAAFDTLAIRIDGMGAKIVEQSDGAVSAQNDVLAQMLSGLKEAQEQTAAAIRQAVTSLNEASSGAAVAMQRELGTALTDGVTASQLTFRTAMEEAGAPMRETAGQLSDAFGKAADMVSRSANEFSRSGDAAAKTAEAFSDINTNARSISLSLTDASKGFATAAQPFADAAQSITGAAGRIERLAEADAAALRSLKELSDGLKDTQEAAEAAWRSYRERFDGVDKALGDVLEKIASTLRESMGEFQRFTTDFDVQMARAIERLGGSVDGMTEYAESLDAYVESLRTSPKAAE